jgi:hypothetical protein
MHALAIFVGLLFRQPVSWLWHGSHSPVGYGHDLPFVYLMWFIAYPKSQQETHVDSRKAYRMLQASVQKNSFVMAYSECFLALALSS